MFGATLGIGQAALMGCRLVFSRKLNITVITGVVTPSVFISDVTLLVDPEGKLFQIKKIGVVALLLPSEGLNLLARRVDRPDDGNDRGNQRQGLPDLWSPRFISL